ncbi:replication protein C, IncQ-type [Hydrogenophaga sp. PML113]|uniref:replication protein C, IncQ-type n=1 Tax=Hydrogenophaga sp. PML113 TaxID=1899350 RepID=UPI0009F7049B|nr:replication protein C, IncQ-type [Hydrogenophaga sp. PML113]
MKRPSLAIAVPPEATHPRVVRLSPPVGLCQLFRPLTKSRAARPTLNETYQYGQDLTLRFSAREALGAPEQTLLLVLLELAEEQHRRRPVEQRLDRTDRTEIGSQLWTSLHEDSPTPLQDEPATLMLSCSWSELHRRCGSTSVGGAVTESRRASLARLCEVTVWEKSEAARTVRSGRLVSWLVGDDQKVHVALNHRLALALLSPGYAQVLLSERLRLDSQTAMLVHAFLSTCLGQGKTMAIGYATLVDRLWPGQGIHVPASTHRRRIADVKSALRSVGRLTHWEVSLGNSVANVVRVRAKPALAQTAERAKREASSTGKDSPVATAREMTRGSHFKVPSASYAEQPFWKNA